MGVQVRKLFEPEHFPGATVLPYFDKYLGPVATRRELACAFGFEINPLHTSRLLELQAAYNERGWRTRFFTETGIGLNDTALTFHSGGEAANLFWTSKLVSEKSRAGDVKIPVVGIARFMRSIAERHLPPESQLLEPRVIVKLDVEGYEFELMQLLADEGLLCGISFIYTEFHATYAPDRLATLLYQLADIRCRTEIIVLDDELGGDTNPPLPGKGR